MPKEVINLKMTNMGRIIVSTGRGGCGKTTFVTLATRYLPTPMLLIDLDPDLSLADMLGIDLKAEKIKTVSDALYDIIEERRNGAQTGSLTVHDKMEFLLQSDCLYEGEKFDLITLGTKLTPGCYCIPDDLLKVHIPRLAKGYRNVVIDSPAGLEHLNRKVVSDIDDIFVLLDPSSKSLKHIERIKDITASVGIAYNNFYLVGNYAFDEESEKFLSEKEEKYLGRVDYDDNLKEYNLNGKSLLELNENSPACSSIKKVLKKAGYSIS